MLIWRRDASGPASHPAIRGECEIETSPARGTQASLAVASRKVSEPPMSDESVAATKAELAKIRLALREVKTSVQVVELKSARSHRTIALPAIAVRSLNRHRVR